MLREAALVVMPSRTEGFCLVALEAISSGVPVLVSSETGIAKALQDLENGMLSKQMYLMSGRIESVVCQNRHEDTDIPLPSGSVGNIR